MTARFPLRGNECECTRCGVVFTSESTFTSHQRGGECLSTDARTRSGKQMFWPKTRTREIDGEKVEVTVWGGEPWTPKLEVAV